MNLEFTAEQLSALRSFRQFVDESVVPVADQCDAGEDLPSVLIQEMAARGYWGALVPKAHGGMGLDQVSFGLLNEELGRGCSSLRSLITVHSMVTHAIVRWGTSTQKEHWLPKLASGEKIAGFALTEPGAGSDIKSIEASARTDGDCYLINGQKIWITCGQRADAFLVFTQTENGPCAFLVDRASPGLVITSVRGGLGLRASLPADLSFTDCRIPASCIVGKAGFGLSHVSACALDCGRYSVAWGCVGLAQACLEASLRYAGQRQQFGSLLKDHQLIQQMISEMVANTKAARWLCLQAGYLKEVGDPAAIMATFVAKYFASKAAAKASADTVQIHGAHGCGETQSPQRWFRDAKLMEIIEGSTQMQEITIARLIYQELEGNALN